MPTPETSIVGRDEVVFRYRDQHVTNPVGRSSIFHLEKTVTRGIPERIEYRLHMTILLFCASLLNEKVLSRFLNLILSVKRIMKE